jgi:peptidyl-prolyl cis-trans isomerase SurA
MKLRDAQVRGYDNNTELMNELNDYKKQVGVTFILEKNIVDPGVEKLYNRRKWELRVSHIMIRPDSAGEQAAKLKAVAILDSIKNGESFEELAKRNSQDFYSAPIGGDIFYITAGMLPSEFEDASYATAPGNVYPEVVKTKYGYHIIKVTDKIERVPKIRASHILVSFKTGKGERDTIEAKARIDSVKMMLNNGADFAELAGKYSDDPGSKDKGGDLGFFERRMMVKEFDETAFKLKVGEISDVIKTNFGYHIIKLTEKAPYPALEEDRENLKKMFRQLIYQAEYDNLVDSLKAKYAYKLNGQSYSQFVEKCDSLKVGTESTNLDEIKNLPLYTYANNTVTISDFWNKISASQDYTNKIVTADLLTNAIKKISGDELLEQEAMNLEKNNEAFASLMDDYKNGIFIFKLQEDEIWNKISVDSVKLYNFYEENKDKYVWSERVSFSEIYSRKDSLANHYLDELNSGANFDTLAAKYTERPGFKNKAGRYELTDAKSNQLAAEAEKLQKPGDYSSVINNAGGFSIVRLNYKEPSRLKTFEEARAEVSGAFQEAESKRLEQEYLDNLKKRYTPIFYYDELKEAFKE